MYVERRRELALSPPQLPAVVTPRRRRVPALLPLPARVALPLPLARRQGLSPCRRLHLALPPPRYGTWRTKWEGYYLYRPRVYANRDRLPVHAGRPDDRDRLPIYVGRPGDRAIIQRWMRRGLSYLDASHAGFLDHGKRGHRRQNAIEQLIRRRMHILVGPYLMQPTARNCITSSSVPLLFASYLIGLISRRGQMTMSARVLAQLLRPMTGRWRIAMQRALPSQTWIWKLGSTQQEGRVYGFGDSLDSTPVSSSYASSVAPPAYTSSSAMLPDSGGEDMRTLIREELHLQFGIMVEQLITAIRGVGPSLHASQVSITINFI
ncbi:hypothetical protein Taro_000787 [Colocasia esculenta]|uniref:Uncharacterized protein n=1 Tax=Colocasia esculenta TaxID=4460 RepID=A0A843TE87_COLES|nr:hypothetical protein [Colocasia esculenta]